MSIDAVLQKTVRDAVDAYLATLEPVAPTYLSPADAATYLGFSAKQLEAWRQRGMGPPYTKMDRAVRYCRTDLDEFMEARRVA